MPCLSRALKVALHCTHAGLVYTVTLMDAAPLRKVENLLRTGNCCGYYVCAMFSGSSRPQIPVLRMSGRMAWRYRFREVHHADWRGDPGICRPSKHYT